MPQPSPAQVWQRRRRRRQFFAWIVTALLLAALVYGWLWVIWGAVTAPFFGSNQIGRPCWQSSSYNLTSPDRPKVSLQ